MGYFGSEPDTVETNADFLYTKLVFILLLQRTFYVRNSCCRHPRVHLSCHYIFVSEQFLDVTDIRAIFQEMRSEAMTQRVKSRGFCTSAR